MGSKFDKESCQTKVDHGQTASERPHTEQLKFQPSLAFLMDS
jgi:hypothetical protein